MSDTVNPAKPEYELFLCLLYLSLCADARNSMGWLFLGMTVTQFLYGVGLAQIYQYIRRPEGRAFLSAFV